MEPGPRSEVGGVQPEDALDSAGPFLMGSPENEEGRFEDEGPQHEVTIERGFWMFDTPCTQALWEAVMGENPEPLQRHRMRPVEHVSWDDCQAFVLAA